MICFKETFPHPNDSICGARILCVKNESIISAALPSFDSSFTHKHKLSNARLFSNQAELLEVPSKHDPPEHKNIQREEEDHYSCDGIIRREEPSRIDLGLHFGSPESRGRISLYSAILGYRYKTAETMRSAGHPRSNIFACGYILIYITTLNCSILPQNIEQVNATPDYLLPN